MRYINLRFTYLLTNKKQCDQRIMQVHSHSKENDDYQNSAQSCCMTNCFFEEHEVWLLFVWKNTVVKRSRQFVHIGLYITCTVYTQWRCY